MKKKYIKPISEEIRIETTGMLAVSSRSFLNEEAPTSGSGEDAEYANTL